IDAWLVRKGKPVAIRRQIAAVISPSIFFIQGFELRNSDAEHVRHSADLFLGRPQTQDLTIVENNCPDFRAAGIRRSLGDVHGAIVEAASLFRPMNIKRHCDNFSSWMSNSRKFAHFGFWPAPFILEELLNSSFSLSRPSARKFEGWKIKSKDAFSPAHIARSH